MTPSGWHAQSEAMGVVGAAATSFASMLRACHPTYVFPNVQPST